MASGEQGPAWLFSFVDLAFLLLLALTQLASERAGVEIGAIALPKLPANETRGVTPDAPVRWQLRIHPPAEAPFELVRPEAGAEGERMAEPAMRERLSELRAARGARPLVAPHEDSRSSDLLVAVGAVEALWPEGRRAVVNPLGAGR